MWWLLFCICCCSLLLGYNMYVFLVRKNTHASVLGGLFLFVCECFQNDVFVICKCKLYRIKIGWLCYFKANKIFCIITSRNSSANNFTIKWVCDCLPARISQWIILDRKRCDNLNIDTKFFLCFSDSCLFYSFSYVDKPTRECVSKWECSSIDQNEIIIIVKNHNISTDFRCDRNFDSLDVA